MKDASVAARRETLCHCGQPLHYQDKALRRAIERLVDYQGEYVEVTVDCRTWKVQRHFIALHGLRAADLPRLGFEEITP